MYSLQISFSETDISLWHALYSSWYHNIVQVKHWSLRGVFNHHGAVILDKRQHKMFSDAGWHHLLSKVQENQGNAKAKKLLDKKMSRLVQRDVDTCSGHLALGFQYFWVFFFIFTPGNMTLKCHQYVWNSHRAVNMNDKMLQVQKRERVIMEIQILIRAEQVKRRVRSKQDHHTQESEKNWKRTQLSLHLLPFLTT